jgi:hypothetical protein
VPDAGRDACNKDMFHSDRIQKDENSSLVYLQRRRARQDSSHIRL